MTSVEPIYRTLGRWLSRKRQQRGVTQAQVARALGVTRASYCNSEHGLQRIMLHQLPTIAAMVGVELDELLVQAFGKRAR